MIDTMMIKLKLDKEVFRRLFDFVNEFLLASDLGKLWFDKNAKRYVTTKLAKHGFLEIAFHKTKFKWYLEVKLQPIRLFRENEIVELCRFEDYYLVESGFNEFWSDVIGCESVLPDFMSFSNWKVNRIDYAFQFRTPYLQTYLDLLQRGRIDKYFTEHEYKTSVYATANTVNLNFYDKYAQLKGKTYLKNSDIESAKNLLRLEVQCKTDYLQKLKKKFGLDEMNVREFWDVNIAQHVLTYRIKTLVGELDFYRLDVANKKLSEPTGNNSLILQSILRCIAQNANITLAKKKFCERHSGVSPEKWDKLLCKLRKNFGINPLTFSSTEKELPPVLKNPCSLLAEDIKRSKVISNSETP